MMNMKFKTVSLIFCFMCFSTGTATADILISAPIFPKYLSFANYEGDKYPTTLAEKHAIADNAFYSFERLFEICQTDNAFKSRLFVAIDGQTLTQAQLASNYNTIAECAYLKFTIKPYFVPQIVEDVDLCSRVLPPNSGWRMITDEDVISWGNPVFQSLTETLNSAASNNEYGMGTFYFSAATYIRTATGLKIGVLYPNIGVPDRIVDLPSDNNSVGRTLHQESVNLVVGPNNQRDNVSITLRCVKTN